MTKQVLLVFSQNAQIHPAQSIVTSHYHSVTLVKIACAGKGYA